MATMTNINISLPEKMRAFVEEKVERDGYGTISEYLRELIRSDERRETSYFDKLIAEAYASDPPIELTKADIDNARKEVHDRIIERQKKK